MTIRSRLDDVARRLGVDQPTNQPPATIVWFGTLTPTVEAEMERRRVQAQAAGLPKNFPLLVQLVPALEREEDDDYWTDFHGSLEQLGKAIRGLIEVEHITEGVVVVPLEGQPYICSL